MKCLRNREKYILESRVQKEGLGFGEEGRTAETGDKKEYMGMDLLSWCIQYLEIFSFSFDHFNISIRKRGVGGLTRQETV